MNTKQLKPLLDETTWLRYKVALTYAAAEHITHVLADQNRGEPLLDGMGPEDFACQAMLDLLTGVEGWDSVAYPNLLTHLHWIVRKQIKNASRRHGTTKITHADDDDAFGADNKFHPPNDEAEANLFVDGFLAYIEKEGDDDLALIVYYMKDGRGRAYIAEKLGMSVADVTNARKRLYRRLSEYKIKIGS